MNERSRLSWRCRRGTVELEVMLARFLDNGYATLDPNGRAAFERLLACEDDQLIGWLLKGETPRDGELAETVVAIRRAARVC